MSILTLPTNWRKVFVLSLYVRGFFWLVHQKWEKNNIFVVATLTYLHQCEKVFICSTNDLLVVIWVICDLPVSSAAVVWSCAELAFLRCFVGLKAISECEESGRFVPNLHSPEGIQSSHLLNWYDPAIISPPAFLPTFTPHLIFFLSTQSRCFSSLAHHHSPVGQQWAESLFLHQHPW